MTNTPKLLAWQRLAQYVAAWDAKPIRGMNDEIHALHTGEDCEGVLRLSDLRAILADRAERESAGAVAWQRRMLDDEGWSEWECCPKWEHDSIVQNNLQFTQARALYPAPHPLPESALRALVEGLNWALDLHEERDLSELSMRAQQMHAHLRAALAQPELLKWLGRK